MSTERKSYKKSHGIIWKDSLSTTKYYRCPENYEDKINKFFDVDYSSKDPSKMKVDFSNEVTDTTTILKAGFSKNDL